MPPKQVQIAIVVVHGIPIGHLYLCHDVPGWEGAFFRFIETPGGHAWSHLELGPLLQTVKAALQVARGQKLDILPVPPVTEFLTE
jgi:hypothetical protein